MMKILRFMVLAVTVPIWLPVVVICGAVCLPLFVAVFIAICIEYGFTGRWDW